LGQVSALGSPQNVNLVWKKAHTNTSHILDAQDMNLQCNKLVNQVQVVLQVVLLVWVQHYCKLAL